VKANELSPLSDEEASAFFHAFSTVPPCETETEESDRKMTAENNQETEETAEAVRSILSSTSILCDFTKNTNVPKCQCGHPAQTRPVRFTKKSVNVDDDDDNDDDDDDDDDDELWPNCKGNYPSTHCFICAAKDDRQFLKRPSSCECGMEVHHVVIRFVTNVQGNRTNKKIVRILDATRRGIYSVNPARTIIRDLVTIW
jgi:hypothetical protein